MQIKTIHPSPRVAPSSYRVPPLAAYEAWREEYGRVNPCCVHATPSAGLLRRVVMLRNAGDSFAGIGRGCGLSAQAVQNAYERLPAGLRHPSDEGGAHAAHDIAELHSNAAQRALRREMVRLNDARLELIGAIDDPRLPAGLAIDQIRQCDREIAQMVEAHDLLEAHYGALAAA
jgi:hypothetical protein